MEDTAIELNTKQELFCYYYTHVDDLFGNGTLAYAEAYQYNLDELSKEKPIVAENPVKYGESEYEKAYNVCSVQASKLLRNPKIATKVTERLNELMKDEVVDSELVRVIKQNWKLDAKMSGIREYNKLKNRITDKIDIEMTSKIISVDE